MLKIFLIFFFLLISFGLSLCQIEWRGNSAFVCDFPENDLQNVQSSMEQCHDRCANTPGCTHFSWTDCYGGTCALKKGAVNKQDAIFLRINKKILCGYVDGIENSKGALVWSDEFDSDSKFRNNWNQETGANVFGNNELQYYTNQRNTEIKLDALTIHTRRENFMGMKYTSSKLTSTRKFKYGIFEMKAKLPNGRGVFPSFKLVSTKGQSNFAYDGEIDIMSHVGFDSNRIYASIQTYAYNKYRGNQKENSTYVSDAYETFHLYQLYWSSKVIRGYIDGELYFEYEKDKRSSFSEWPFDNEFNLVISNGVGGDLAGQYGIDDYIFPTKYVIDYVRYFSLK